MQISNKVQRYLDLAKRKAWESNFHQKHGSVLVKGGSVINTSCNSAQFSKFAGRFRNEPRHATRHAEIMCILGLAREVTEGSTMYVVRINNSGNLMLSKPCSMCCDVLSFIGIKKVFYSVSDGKIRCQKIK